MLCQITRNPYADPIAIALTNADFVEGSLQRVSYARPGKLFTAHETLFHRAAGTLTPVRYRDVVETIISMLRRTVNP